MQKVVLQHVARDAFQRASIELLSVEEQLALELAGELQTPSEQVHECSLAGAARAHDGEQLAGSREPRDVLEDGLIYHLCLLPRFACLGLLARRRGLRHRYGVGKIAKLNHRRIAALVREHLLPFALPLLKLIGPLRRRPGLSRRELQLVRHGAVCHVPHTSSVRNRALPRMSRGSLSGLLQLRPPYLRLGRLHTQPRGASARS